MQGYQGDDGKLARRGRRASIAPAMSCSSTTDGYFTFVGRADDVFKSSDYRISPFELESVLLEHARWRKQRWCRARMRSGLRCRRRMCLLVAGTERSAETARSIFRHLHGGLAPFKRIRRIEFVTELPKTISGKNSPRAIASPRAEMSGTIHSAARNFAKNNFRSCRKCAPTGAVNLKFLPGSRQASNRNFKFKTALASNRLLESFDFAVRIRGRCKYLRTSELELRLPKIE